MDKQRDKDTQTQILTFTGKTFEYSEVICDVRPEVLWSEPCPSNPYSEMLTLDMTGYGEGVKGSLRVTLIRCK